MLSETLQFELPPAMIVLVSVLVPMIAATYLWCREPMDRRQQGGVALSFSWNFLTLLTLNALAVRVGWWEFGAAGPELLGVSIPLLLGWALLWGVIAPLLRLRPILAIAAMAVIDLVYMPMLKPSLLLGDGWLIGEVLALVVVAWPGLLMSRWMSNRRRLGALVLMQVAMFALSLLWLVPAVATDAIGSSWAWEVSPYLYGVLLGAIGLVSLPAVIAVHDFYLNRGTPWPWDTTDRPVLSGAYRYVRSPMQASATALLVVMSVVLRQPVVLIAALSAVGYSRLFSRSEFADLSVRFGPEWTSVAEAQRRWIPSLRPSSHGAKASLWLDMGCTVCAPVAAFLAARLPVGLELRDAADHPEALTRIRYERADGATFSGVRALGAALEHLHLGWAFLGWLLRCPGLSKVWQLIGDEVGFGPRPVSAGVPRVTGDLETKPNIVRVTRRLG